MTFARNGRLSLGICAVMVALALGVMTLPASAAGFTLHRASGHTSAKLATVVRTDRHGVTYRLPSGRTLTLGRGGAHLDSEPGSVDFLSRTTITTDAGVDYDLAVDASKYLGGDGNGTILVLSLHRESSTGSTTAYQAHTYVFQLPDAALQFSETGPEAILTTDTGLAEWGRVQLSFTSHRGPIQFCHGNAELWRGSSAGSMAFTPQGDNGYFGTIKRSVFHKAQLSLDRGCGYPPPSQPTSVTRRCPTPGASAYGETDGVTRSFFIEDDAVGDDFEEYATLQISRDPALIFHQIAATSATSGLITGLDSTATLVAFPDSFMSGTAAFAPEGRFFIDGPYTCGAGRTFRVRYQGGRITGTSGDPFSADFDTGAAVVPVDPADAMYADLDKLIVR